MKAVLAKGQSFPGGTCFAFVRMGKNSYPWSCKERGLVGEGRKFVKTVKREGQAKPFGVRSPLYKLLRSPKIGALLVVLLVPSILQCNALK